MNKTIIFLMLFMSIFAFMLVGCEFGKYPLILDSSVTSGAIRVDLNSPLPVQVTQTTSVNISELREVTGESVDSMKLYDITLFIENDTSQLGADITGYIKVNDDTLATLDDVELSTFHSEHSIFDSINGFKIGKKGVRFLLEALKTQSPETVTITVTAGTDASSLHFDLKVKLYGQIFASTN